MDRYEKILDDINWKTEHGPIAWKALAATDIPEAIYPRERIRRCFQADYALTNRLYKLYFVERAYRVDDDEFGNSEARMRVLYVLDPSTGVIIFELDDSLVEREDLARLSGEIEAANDQAQEFFRAFEATNPE